MLIAQGSVLSEKMGSWLFSSERLPASGRRTPGLEGDVEGLMVLDNGDWS